MVPIIVEAVSVGIKPPVVDDSMRTSTGGKCGFDASASLLTRSSPMHFSGPKRGSAVLLNLVKLVGPRASFNPLQHLPYACESLCQVLRLFPWRDVATELGAAGLLIADLLLSSSQ